MCLNRAALEEPRVICKQLIYALNMLELVRQLAGSSNHLTL